MKTYFFLIIGGLAICFYIYYSKEYEIAKLNEANQIRQQVERAAIQNFSSVNAFLKLFPEAHYHDGNFIALPSDIKENIYTCKLPPFTITKNRVIFNGSPSFESSTLILLGQSAEVGNIKILNIDEIENEILKK